MFWVIMFPIIGWLMLGLLSVILFCVYDMRNSKYDENYFKGEMEGIIWFSILGVAGLFVMIIYIICDAFSKKKNRKKKNHYVTKLLYKIANIGVKNKSE